jgi:hypothetical protein
MPMAIMIPLVNEISSRISIAVGSRGKNQMAHLTPGAPQGRVKNSRLNAPIGHDSIPNKVLA